MKQLTILLIYLLIVFSAQAQNQTLSSEELKETIENYFILDDAPVRYYSNILIKIQGEASPEDSVYLLGLIDTLNTHISTWDVYLISEGTSNLVLQINDDDSELYGSTRLGNKNRQEIVVTHVIADMPADADDITRRKILYFQLMRALVHFRDSEGLKAHFPGCVFAESKWEKITFHPADFQLLKGIYSKKFDDKMRSGEGAYKPIPAQKLKLYRLLASLAANILPLFLLLLVFQKGVFTYHRFVLRTYLKQGGIVLLAGLLSLIIIAVGTFPYNSNFSVNIFGIIASILIVYFIAGTMALFLMYYSEKFILKDNNSLLFHTVFPFLTTTIIPSFFLTLMVLLIRVPNVPNPGPFDIFVASLTFISLFISVAVFRAFLIYISRKSDSLIHQKDVELARISEMHKQAELQSLRSKINPHFLYNSLNSIASLARTNPDKTEQMALSLSDFFRYSINREQKQMNSINEELEAVKTYLEIEKVRFGKRLNFSIDCPQDLLETEIPQLLIQPLVENSIKHGISKLLEDGQINITVRREDRTLRLKVSDNGPEFPSGPLSGFGIRNTSERLQLVYGKRASINWEKGQEKYIEITLPI